MGQIGTLGDYDIPLFEKDDVSKPYCVVELSDGRQAYFNMVPQGEGDRPAFRYEDTSGQIWESSRSVITVIDDFERGDLTPYTTQGSGTSTVEAASAYEGSYGLTLAGGGNEQVWSNAGDGLETYPEPGTRTVVLWKTTTQTSPEFWFGTTAGMPNGRYQLEYFWDNTLQLRTYTSGNERYKYQNLNVQASVNTWYQWIIDWRAPWRSRPIVVEMRRASSGAFMAGLYIDDTTHSNPAIGFEGDGTNGGKTMWDFAHRVPSSSI